MKQLAVLLTLFLMPEPLFAQSASTAPYDLHVVVIVSNDSADWSRAFGTNLDIRRIEVGGRWECSANGSPPIFVSRIKELAYQVDILDYSAGFRRSGRRWFFDLLEELLLTYDIDIQLISDFEKPIARDGKVQVRSMACVLKLPPALSTAAAVEGN